jgi:hypothetical protein
MKGISMFTDFLTAVVLAASVLATSQGTGTPLKGEQKPQLFGVPQQPPPVKADTPPAVPQAGQTPAPPSVACEWKEVTLPSSSKVAGLELPPDQQVPGTKRFVLLTAKTDKPEQEVKWLVIGSVANSQPSAITFTSSKTLQVFPVGHKDLIVVIAWTAVDGKLSEPAVTRIEVDGPPPPAATVAPAPVKRLAAVPAHITVLVADPSAVTATKIAGCEVHVFTPKNVPVDMRDVFREIGPFPAYIIQSSDGDILAKGQFKTVDDLTRAVKGGRP